MNRVTVLNFDNLKIHLETVQADTILLRFDGEIHENFKSKQISIPKAASYVVNLSGLKSINSLGIREWSTFVAILCRNANVTLDECSVVFIDQANIVPQILAASKVTSFFAPYFCPQCNLELNCKLSTTTHRKRLQERRAPQIIHSCGAELQFDALEESFFAQADRLLGDK
ncbi:MAG: hypothetical protein EBR09_04570 [Proteobacteria bacterium]|nr:hypothetical protein [Pseudomonadota bacterium]